MKSKSGLILSFAVLAAVIAGLVLPGYLLKLDKTPSFDLDGYQTVEISTASSTDYAWRIRVISHFFTAGGGGGITYTDVTEQYSEEQRENIHQQFIAQLSDLETRGVLAAGTGEIVSRSRRADSRIFYLFDADNLRGTQFATVYVTDPEEPGLQLLFGVVDLESGKIMGLSGYTSAWSELMTYVNTEENAAQEILESFSEYLGMVEPTGDPEIPEEPPHSINTIDENYFAELRLVALPSNRPSAKQMWIEFGLENFLLYLQS